MANFAKLTDRGVLALSGPNVKDFLQGICTQDINLLDTQPCLYGAHLTTRGKFLFDFFIWQKEKFLLLDCHRDELMELAKNLHKYAITEKVEFDDFTEDYDVYALWGDDLPPCPEGSLCTTDPRLPQLGQRLLVAGGESLPAGATEKSVEEYTRHRLSLGIPDGHVDALKGRTLTGELGLEFINGVNFDKGCYVGQELTARLHYRTEAKKRLYKVTFEGNAPAPETPVMCGTQEAGWLFSASGNTGLAILRTRYVEKSEPLLLNDQPITPETPVWWLQETR